MFVHAELVVLGYAVIATFPPDVRHQGLFLEMEREARGAGQGLWTQPAVLNRNYQVRSREASRL